MKQKSDLIKIPEKNWSNHNFMASFLVYLNLSFISPTQLHSISAEPKFETEKCSSLRSQSQFTITTISTSYYIVENKFILIFLIYLLIVMNK